MSEKRIIAIFKGDYTGFEKTFDCTEAILKLPLKEIIRIEDHDTTSDSLAPENIIEEARQVFVEEWGTGSKNMQFGFEVTVRDQIADYFGLVAWCQANAEE